MRRHDEEGLDVMSFKETVPLMAMARLHLIVPIQAGKGRLRDVNLPMGKGCRDVQASGPAAWGLGVQDPQAHLHS